MMRKKAWSWKCTMTLFQSRDYLFCITLKRAVTISLNNMQNLPRKQHQRYFVAPITTTTVSKQSQPYYKRQKWAEIFAEMSPRWLTTNSAHQDKQAPLSTHMWKRMSQLQHSENNNCFHNTDYTLTILNSDCTPSKGWYFLLVPKYFTLIPRFHLMGKYSPSSKAAKVKWVGLN